MIRVEPNVVLKYSPVLDEFVRIRSFTPGEIAEVLRCARVPDKASYRALVLSACLVPFASILDAADRIPAGRRALEDDLLRLCVEINPGLNISQVTFPAAHDPRNDLHLLQAPAPAGEDRASKARRLRDDLRRRIVGQPEAVDAVARVVRRNAAGLRDERRPMGTFFFIGQTGVGKTELAKALTDLVFEDRSHLVRIDCSEYALPHEVAKLIGAPPGYVGHGDGGFLTGEMKKKGAAVVLFDEIEKADPKVHNLLLQLLDEGMLTDSHGEKIPFRDTIVIMTSNVGVEEVREARGRIGFDGGNRALGRADLHDCTLGALKREFRPEFLNRVDEVVLFNPLTLEDGVHIVELCLRDVVDRAQRASLRLTWSSSVPRFLAEAGFNPEYGARELRRTVRDLVEDPLADRILEGAFPGGGEVRMTVKRGHVDFRN